MAVKRMSVVRSLLFVAVFGFSFFTSSVWAQGNPGEDGDTAYVPFVVNVDATVHAYLSCVAIVGQICPDVSMQVRAGKESILRIPLAVGRLDGVRFFGTQRLANIPTIISGKGRVVVNLPEQSYKSAEVSLYAVNGKRILHNRVNAVGAENNAVRRSVAPGVYFLSVKGDGGVITSKLTHDGGRLDMGVVFIGENAVSGVNRQSKAAVLGLAPYVEVDVNALGGGYIGDHYVLSVVPGINPVQNITLQAVGGGE